MATESEVKSTVKTQKAKAEKKYPFSDFYENPGVLGTTQDIVMAAFKYNGIESATVKEAQKIVDDFKGRKVTC